MKVNDLGNDGIVRLIFKLALPAMVAQFVNVLYGIVDRIFISNIPVVGDAALAGLGVCAPVLGFLTSFCFLVGLGGAPLAAMRMGQKNLAGAQKVLSNCFVLLLALSAVLTVVFLVFKTPMLRLFGASDNIIGYADTYLTIYVAGSAFALLSIGLNNFITCQGFSKAAMSSVLIGAVMNICLDPLFIFTFKMGVAGAAIATVISEAASCIWVVLFLTGKRTALRLSFKNLSARLMLKVAKIGLSPFLIIATDSVVIILFNAMLQKTGGENGDTLITAATVVLSFMQLFTMPMGGITLGCQPIISFNYGANRPVRVKKAFVGVLITCLAFAAVMLAVSFTAPGLFVGIFSDDSTIAATAMWGIRVYTVGFLFLAVQYACVDTLTALGKAGLAFTLSLTRKIVIMTSLLVAFPLLMGAQAAFYAEPIADIASCLISGTTCLVLFKKIFKKPYADEPERV